MKYRNGLIASSFAVVALAFACSSSDSTPAPANGDGGAGGGSSGTASCASQPSFLTCVTCCNPPQSYFNGQDAFNNCVCDTACKTECADSCNSDKDPSPACATCIDADATHTTCAPKAQALCDADPACKTYQACAEAAKCEDKGDDDDAG